MYQPGVYHQPFPRKTVAHVPLVAGYTTARFYNPTLNVSGYQGNYVSALFENVGEETASLRLYETDDYVSGPRTQIGGAFSLVPNGFVNRQFTPTKPYIEINGVSGTSELRVQFESAIEWQLQSFDKLETVYPSTLAKHQPDDAPFPE